MNRSIAFQKVEDEFFRLKGQLAAGRISTDQFTAALKDLVFEYDGRYWMMGVDTGTWYVHDGQNWIEADPPPTESAASESRSTAIVATIGHVGHGKTTLTAAITKVLALKGQAAFVSYDELARNSSAAISRVKYRTETHDYEHIDCPARDDYIKDVISREPRMDGVILVVATIPGPTSQDGEHIRLASQRGVHRIVVFLNEHKSVDDPELVDLEVVEIRELLSRYAFPGNKVPIVCGNALTTLASTSKDPNAPEYRSILSLMKEMDEHIRLGQLPQRT